MDFEEWGSVHFLMAGVFALALTLGSFAVTAKMQSLSDDQMSDVSGQEGIVMDMHMSGFAIQEVTLKDADGYSTGQSGALSLHNIQFTGAGDFTGVTVDFDGSTTVGGTNQGAIVVGLPNIPDGIKVGNIVPGDGDATTVQATDSGNSLGTGLIGGVEGSGSKVEISHN